VGAHHPGCSPTSGGNISDPRAAGAAPPVRLHRKLSKYPTRRKELNPRLRSRVRGRLRRRRFERPVCVLAAPAKPAQHAVTQREARTVDSYGPRGAAPASPAGGRTVVAKGTDPNFRARPRTEAPWFGILVFVVVCPPRALSRRRSAGLLVRRETAAPAGGPRVRTSPAGLCAVRPTIAPPESNLRAEVAAGEVRPGTTQLGKAGDVGRDGCPPAPRAAAVVFEHPKSVGPCADTAADEPRSASPGRPCTNGGRSPAAAVRGLHSGTSMPNQVRAGPAPSLSPRSPSRAPAMGGTRALRPLKSTAASPKASPAPCHIWWAWIELGQHRPTRRRGVAFGRVTRGTRHPAFVRGRPCGRFTHTVSAGGGIGPLTTRPSRPPGRVTVVADGAVRQLIPPNCHRQSSPPYRQKARRIQPSGTFVRASTAEHQYRPTARQAARPAAAAGFTFPLPDRQDLTAQSRPPRTQTEKTSSAR